MPVGIKLGADFWKANDTRIIRLYQKGYSPIEIQRKTKINSTSIIRRLQVLGHYKKLGKGGYQKIEITKATIEAAMSLAKKEQITIFQAACKQGLTCDRRIFAKAVKKHFPQVNLRRRLQIDLHLLHTMYFKKLKSISQCAEYLGVSVAYLQDVFKEQNWKMRPPGKTKLQRTYRKFSKLGRTNKDWMLYSFFVRCLSNRVFSQWEAIINPKGLVRSKNLYHVDHRYSISRSFKTNKVTWKQVCHPANLILLPAKKNLSKGSKCSLSAKKLKAKIKQFESIHGKVPMKKYAGALLKSELYLRRSQQLALNADRQGKYMDQQGVVPPRI